ncbi:MAG: carbohydrate ABC transporter permease, partial [Fusobacteriaceae bacterium]
MNGMVGKFIAFDNFKDLLTNHYFWTSFKNTWIMWLLNFIPQLCGALLIAVLLTSVKLKLRFVGFFRTIFFIPNLLMPVAVAALFSTLLSNYGVVNQFLVRFGVINDAVNWLNSPRFAIGTVAFIQWWMWFGQTVIIIGAGMTSISPTYYEAGIVDGASQTRMFFNITLPLLKPIIAYVLVTSVGGGLQMFDIPFLLTDGIGSPDDYILTMNMLMNLKRTSTNGDIGSAAAVSILIFLVSSIFAFLIM